MADDEQARPADWLKLLKPDDYEWLDDILRSAPPTLLPDLAIRYEQSLMEPASYPSDTLIRGLRDYERDVPKPLFPTWSAWNGAQLSMADNQRQASAYYYGGSLVEAQRRMEPTRAFYAAQGVDVRDLTERGKVRLQRTLVDAAAASARAAEKSATEAGAAQRDAAHATRATIYTGAFVAVITALAFLVELMR